MIAVARDIHGTITVTGMDGAQTLQKKVGAGAYVNVAAYQPGASVCVEYNPWWNWHRGHAGQTSITESCLAAGVCMDIVQYIEDYSQDAPTNNFDVSVNGVQEPFDSYYGYSAFRDPNWPSLRWGKRWSAVASRTILLTNEGEDWDLPGAIIGWVWSDWEAQSGETVTYKYGAETATVVLGVDRQAVVQALIDRIVTLYGDFTDPATIAPMDMYLNTVTGLYTLVPDARLIPIADRLFSIMEIQCGSQLANFIPINAPDNPLGSVITTGRWISALHGAYKAFGIDTYLEAACKAVGYALNSWVKSDVVDAVNGVTYVDVWANIHDGSPRELGSLVGNDIPGRNHLSKLVGGCALICNEPDIQSVAGGAYASLYQKVTLKTLIQNNMDAAIGLTGRSRIDGQGRVAY